MLTSKRGTLITIALTAGLISLMLFLRVVTYDFVNYDDPHYVYENPAIRILDWRFIFEAFTTSYMGWWMPLTWISFAVDYQLWGLNPVGYHLENVFFHVVNAGLVVLVADQLLREKCGERYYPLILLLAALIWAIHPLRVESVAWIAERKDVLNGSLSLLSIYYYLRWVRLERTTDGGKGRVYFLSLLFYMLSLMAKPASVMLPVMFLVLDWYPLRRLEKNGYRGLVVEKLPFFLVSVLLVVVTLTFAAEESILISFSDHPLHNRIFVAGYALIEYLRLNFCPSGLVHFYPIRPELPLPYYINTTLAVLITVYSIRNRARSPWLLAGWLLFILPLLPVLGFFQNGDQSHANRFTYLSAVLPSIAAAVVIFACVARCAQKVPRCRAAVFFVLILSLLLYGAVTVNLIGVWRNSDTLWSRQIAVQPVGRAFLYRGEYFLRIGEFSRAAEDFAAAIGIAVESGNPEVFNLHALRGDALNKNGRALEAVDEFTSAIRIRPYANYFYHRSLAFERLGRHAEAAADLLSAGNDRSPVEWKKSVGGDSVSNSKVLSPTVKK